MGVSAGVTDDDLDGEINSFSNEYALAYPYGSEYSFPLLREIFIAILVMSKIFDNGYSVYMRINYSEDKLYWLFWNIPFMSLSSQLRAFMIKINDPSLSHRTYALLFYVSLQSVEIQKSVEGLPLSMLYDMFLPVAEANLDNWKLGS
jgi:hypothetical protein